MCLMSEKATLSPQSPHLGPQDPLRFCSALSFFNLRSGATLCTGIFSPFGFDRAGEEKNSWMTSEVLMEIREIREYL